jgi:predicted transcriptional regulator
VRVSEASREAAIARFIERMALALTESGVPRMPSRVFCRLLVNDSGKATAAELAESLQVSPAAISGAVRYLDQVGLISRARDPGERRDHYEVRDNIWYEVYGDRDRQFQQWGEVMAEGIAAVGEGTPAGERLAKTQRFFEFLRKAMPELMERWRAEEEGL